MTEGTDYSAFSDADLEHFPYVSSEKARAALSREEWAEAERRGILSRARESGDAAWEIVNDFPHYVDGDARHALAAISLHGQPFGFTRKDVDVLRDAAIVVADGPALSAYLGAIADRIAALLPPEST